MSLVLSMFFIFFFICFLIHVLFCFTRMHLHRQSQVLELLGLEQHFWLVNSTSFVWLAKLMLYSWYSKCIRLARLYVLIYIRIWLISELLQFDPLWICFIFRKAFSLEVRMSGCLHHLGETTLQSWSMYKKLWTQPKCNCWSNPNYLY